MSRVTVVLKTNEGGMWILPQIAELAHRGHVVTTIIPAGDGRLRRALDEAGYPVAETTFGFSFQPRPRLPLDLLRLRRLVRSTRPDVLFYHLYASALATRIASLGLGVPRVHMVAGPLYLESRGIRLAERVLRRLDTHIIAGSRYTARRYRRIGQPPSRMSVVPYGVDLERFRPAPDQRVALLGCSATTLVAIMVAYVYAPKASVFPGVGIKGHEVLLDAWADFCVDHPPSLLVLVGGGFDQAGEEHRQSLIERHGGRANPNVQWVGSVDDVRPFYASADVSVSPSISENHGAALEASAMGLPLIVTDAGGLPETVVPGSGWVVPAGSVHDLTVALRRAAQLFHEGELATMGSVARDLAERRFDQATSTSLVAQAIESALVGRTTGSRGGGKRTTASGSPLHPVAEARVERHGSRRTILAITEQRVALVEGGLVGRSPLGIVSALASVAPVRLAARCTEDVGAVALAPEADSVPLAWPAGGSLLHRCCALLRGSATLLAEVRHASVVYADQPGITGASGLVIGRILRKPLVVNVVGDAAESLHPSVMPGLHGRLGHFLVPRLEKWACANALLINYVTASELQKRYPARAARSCFSSSTAAPLGPPRPRAFPGGTDTVSVVTVGSLERPYKGVSDLIAAVALLARMGLTVRLTVVGDGRCRQQLEEEASSEAHGLVRFLGHLDRQQLYEELGHHNVFALASWTEGLPRALVEAMADGIPCVATAVGGVPELLQEGRTAPPRNPQRLASCLQDLLSDEQAWFVSIAHNSRASDNVFSRASGRERFVGAIAAIATEAPR